MDSRPGTSQRQSRGSTPRSFTDDFEPGTARSRLSTPLRGTRQASRGIPINVRNSSDTSLDQIGGNSDAVSKSSLSPPMSPSSSFTPRTFGAASSLDGGESMLSQRSNGRMSPPPYGVLEVSTCPPREGSITPQRRTPDRPARKQFVSRGAQCAPIEWSRYFFPASHGSQGVYKKGSFFYQHFDVVVAEQTSPGGTQQPVAMSGKQELPTPPPGWEDHDTWLVNGGARLEVKRFLNEGFQTLYYLTGWVPKDYYFGDTGLTGDFDADVRWPELGGRSGSVGLGPDSPMLEEDSPDPGVDLPQFCRYVCQLLPRTPEDHKHLLRLQQGLLLYMTELFQMKHGQEKDENGEDAGIDDLMKDIAQPKAKTSPPPRASPRQQPGRQQPPAISTPTRQDQPVPAMQSGKVEDASDTSGKQTGTQQTKIGEHEDPRHSSPAAARESEEPGQSELVKQLKEDVERYKRQLTEQDEHIESLQKQIQTSSGSSDEKNLLVSAMEGRLKVMEKKLAVSEDQTALIERLEDEKKECLEDLAAENERNARLEERYQELELQVVRLKKKLRDAKSQAEENGSAVEGSAVAEAEETAGDPADGSAVEGSAVEAEETVDDPANGSAVEGSAVEAEDTAEDPAA